MRLDWDLGGIDASLTSTGVCRIRAVEYETMTVGQDGVTKLSVKERMKVMDELSEKIVSFVDTCKAVAIEEYSYGSKGQAIVTMGEFGGIIRHKLWVAGVRTVEVPPTTLKMWLSGSGKATKEMMAVHVYKHFKVEFPTTDETDAFALCHLLEDLIGITEPKFKYRGDAIKALKC